MARRKSSRGRVFYYPSSLPKMQDGDRIINEDTVPIRVDVANNNTTWNPKFTDIINNPSNYSQVEVLDAVQKMAALFPDSDKIITTPGVSPSEAGTRYVERDPATGLPKLKKGGNIQKQGYKNNSLYKNRPYIDIHSNHISMDDVSIPLFVETDTGEERILEPNSGEYYFPGAKVVREIPLRDTPLYFSPSSRGLTKYQTGGFLPMYEEGGDVSEENVTEEDVSDAIIDEYIETLMQQENAAMKGYDAEKGLWFPHDAPEEGGGKDIGYGHKIKSDEDFSEGLTDDQVRSLLASDLAEKMDSAARKFNNKSYNRTWDDLSTEEQILLTDYEYNVGLTKFPKLMKAVAEQDIETMLSQYKRYSDGKPLTSRNNWTKGFIEDKIKRVSANPEEETMETLKTTPIDNKVAPNVILNTFPQGQTQNLETKSSEAIPNSVQSTSNLERVTQAPYPIRKEQLGTLDERQYTLDNIVSPVVGNPFKGKDNYSRTRGPGEKGSGLYDTEGKKYSLVDYYDKKTGEKVGTYNPMTNQVIDEYQKGGQLPKAQVGLDLSNLYNKAKNLITESEELDYAKRLVNTLPQYLNPKTYSYSDEEGLDSIPNYNKYNNFSEAFKQAREDLGRGQTFLYNGKRYTTNKENEFPNDESETVFNTMTKTLSPEQKNKAKEYYFKQGAPYLSLGADDTKFNILPNAQVSFSDLSNRAHVNPVGPYNKVYLETMDYDFTPDEISEYEKSTGKTFYDQDVNLLIDELAHIEQVRDKGTGPFFKHFFFDGLKGELQKKSPYDMEGAIEHSAHQVIGPKRLKEIMGYQTGGQLPKAQDGREQLIKKTKDWYNSLSKEQQQYVFMNTDKYKLQHEILFPKKQDEKEKIIQTLPNKYNATMLDEVTVEAFPNATPAQREALSTGPGNPMFPNPIYRNAKTQLMFNKQPGNFVDETKDAFGYLVAGAPMEGLQTPQSLLVEGIEAARGNDYNFKNALPQYVSGATNKQRLPSQTFLQNAPFPLQLAGDILIDPFAVAGAAKGGINAVRYVKNFPKAFALNLDDVGRQALKPSLNTKQLPGSSNVVGELVNKSITPIGYDPFTVAASPLELLTPKALKFKPKTFATKNRFDAWRLYNGLEPEFNTFSKNADGTLAINDFRLEKSKLQAIVDKPKKSFGTMEIEPEFNFAGVHGNGMITKGVDEQGRKFIDFTDTWDLQPLKGVKGLPEKVKEFEVSSLTGGKPFDLKNRIYYDDAGNFFDHNGNKLVEEMQHFPKGVVDQHKAVDLPMLSTKNVVGTKQTDVLNDWEKAVNQKFIKGAGTVVGGIGAGIGYLTYKEKQKLKKQNTPPAAIIGAGVAGSQYFSNPQEQVEYRNGGQLPRAEVMIDPATGLPKLKKGGKAWIQGAIKKPGASRAGLAMTTRKKKKKKDK